MKRHTTGILCLYIMLTQASKPIYTMESNKEEIAITVLSRDLIHLHKNQTIKEEIAITVLGRNLIERNQKQKILNLLNLIEQKHWCSNCLRKKVVKAHKHKKPLSAKKIAKCKRGTVERLAQHLDNRHSKPRLPRCLDPQCNKKTFSSSTLLAFHIITTHMEKK